MAIIGIDLGVSNSAAAVLRGGRLVIIPSAEAISLGAMIFPGYVAITAEGQQLVAEPDQRQASVNPDGSITDFKRKMGLRNFSPMNSVVYPETTVIRKNTDGKK